MKVDPLEVIAILLGISIFALLYYLGILNPSTILKILTRDV